MNIRDWPLDRIMQLPDHCFGRRWPIIFSLKEPYELYFYISEMALPDYCVLWELYVCSSGVAAVGPPPTLWDVDVSFKLGDRLPANLVEFTAMEDIFTGADEIVNGNRVVRPVLNLSMRMSIHSAGRRVVVRVDQTGYNAPVSIGLVISSIPMEVPDCLLSV